MIEFGTTIKYSLHFLACPESAGRVEDIQRSMSKRCHNSAAENRMWAVLKLDANIALDS